MRMNNMNYTGGGTPRLYQERRTGTNLFSYDFRQEVRGVRGVIPRG
jgi:hypothetical protein